MCTKINQHIIMIYRLVLYKRPKLRVAINNYLFIFTYF